MVIRINLCWLIGHYPIGPVWEHISKKGKIWIYKCKRCDRLIVFNDRKGWVKW